MDPDPFGYKPAAHASRYRRADRSLLIDDSRGAHVIARPTDRVQVAKQLLNLVLRTSNHIHRGDGVELAAVVSFENHRGLGIILGIRERRIGLILVSSRLGHQAPKQ